VKCIKCQNDSKYSERADGTCPKCHGKFAFEPKSGDIFTDPAFAAAIERVSAHDAVRFTEANLYYELARTKKSAAPEKAVFVVLGFVAVLVGGFVSLAASSGIPLIVALSIVGYIAYKLFLWKPPVTPALEQAVFSSLLERWKRAHGSPAKLVRRVAPSSRNDSKKALPKELVNYSFDRAVICDRPETVDLLLANNFHFENNCAVLSVDRYPEAVFDSVLEMLRRNPKIEVYALHDASAEGHDLARKLATSPEWFRGIGRVTDVGILVKHAAKMRGLWKALPQPRAAAFPDLSAEENAWLSAYTLELAAIRPEQIIKRLFRAMTQPGVQVTTDDGGFFFVGGSFGGSDAGTSDGGGDSFG
jgi:hypothetical protein